ncbi:MAG: cyclic nucleotide-binding/CBS domain-containing protein [Candidatus Bathyarchaeia archaeon]
MRTARVWECASRPVRTIGAEASVRDVVKEMNRHKVASILVTEDGKPVGIITERDILQRVIEEGKSLESTRAEDVMSQPVQSIDSNAPLEEACQAMALLRVKKLLVLRDGRPEGLVTIADLIKKILSLHNEQLEGWEKAVVQAWESF